MAIDHIDIDRIIAGHIAMVAAIAIVTPIVAITITIGVALLSILGVLRRVITGTAEDRLMLPGVTGNTAHMISTPIRSSLIRVGGSAVTHHMIDL